MKELIPKQDLIEQANKNKLKLGINLLQTLSNKSYLLTDDETRLTPCIYDWCNAMVINRRNVCNAGHPQS